MSLDRKINSIRLGMRLISPASFSVGAYLVFMVSMLIPSGFYYSVMREQNHIFLDVPSFVFVSVCVVAFLIGVSLFETKNSWAVIGKPRVSPAAIFIVLAGALIMDVFSLYILAKNNPSFLTYVFANDQDAEQVRNYLDYSSAFAESLPFLIATLFWANYRRKEYELVCQRRVWALDLLVYLSLIVATATCVLKLARYELMPLIFGFWVTGVMVRLRYGAANHRTLIRQACVLLIVILCVFLIFSWIRGYQEGSALQRSVFGYGPASYNRLALVLDGQIKVPSMGSGINVFPGLQHIPLLYRFVDLKSALGLPSVEVARAAEFVAIARGGLDPAFNWVSAFGYVYYDLGWFSPIYFFVFGLFSREVWKGVRCGSSYAIVFYPFVLFSIVFWFGTNYFFRSSFFTWVAVGVVVSSVELVSRAKFSSR